MKRQLGWKRKLLAVLHVVFVVGALHLAWRALAGVEPVDPMRLMALVLFGAGSGGVVLAWLTGNARIRDVAITLESLCILMASVAIWRLWDLDAQSQKLNVLFAGAIFAASTVALVRDRRAAIPVGTR